MFSRILRLKSVGPVRNFFRTKVDYEAPSGMRMCHMNDLLVPSGSWKEGYQKQQKKFNVHLIFGIVFFIISTTTAYNANLIQPALTPPKIPIDASAP